MPTPASRAALLMVNPFIALTLFSPIWGPYYSTESRENYGRGSESQLRGFVRRGLRRAPVAGRDARGPKSKSPALWRGALFRSAGLGPRPAYLFRSGRNRRAGAGAGARAA